ncbi:MAG: M6 family metalloprotease domain-containing protein [Promethearchaeota archaeon]
MVNVTRRAGTILLAAIVTSALLGHVLPSFPPVGATSTSLEPDPGLGVKARVSEENGDDENFMVYLSLPKPGTSPGVHFPQYTFRNGMDPRKPRLLTRGSVTPPYGPLGAGPSGESSSTEDEYCVILVQFTDITASTSKDTINSRVFGSTDSVKAYYGEVSYGSFDVAGSIAGDQWWTVNNDMKEYGEDGAGGAIDQANGHPNRLTKDALSKADPSVNFAAYDKNSDGVVDHLVVIHAGKGQEEDSDDTDLIWSHYSGVRYDTDDGVTFNDYAMAAETSQIGIIAHEMGHDLGLPDLYDVDYSSDGIGRWGMMSAGSWLGSPAGSSPAHFCAWSKVQLGFVTPTVVEKSATNLAIPQVETSAFVVKLEVSGLEYFLLENREKQGYDQFLPGSGLLIWHVDDAESTNEEDEHRWVDLEEADGNGELDSYGGAEGESTDPWTDESQGFTPDSVPNSDAYDGVPSGWKVTGFSKPGSSMTATISKFHENDAGVEEISAPQCVNESHAVSINVTATNFGTGAISSVSLEVNVYSHDYSPATRVYSEGFALGTLPAGENTSTALTFTPNSTGRYIVEARVQIANGTKVDENPQNDEKFVHFTVLAPINGVYWDFEEPYQTEVARWDDYYEHPSLLYDHIKGVDWALVNSSVNETDAYSGNAYWNFGFHSWNFQGWHVQNLKNYNGTLEMANNVSLAGLTQAHLVFYARYILQDVEGQYQLQQPQNVLKVQVTRDDGATWEDLLSYKGNHEDWFRCYANLSSYVGEEVRIRFRMQVQVAVTGGGFSFEDLVVTTTPLEHGVVAVPVENISVTRGGTTSTSVKVVNVGDFAATFHVTLGTYDEASLSVGFSDTYVALGIDATAHVPVNITALEGAGIGKTYQVTFEVASLNASWVEGEMNLTVVVVEGGGIPRFWWWVIGGTMAASATIGVLVLTKRRRRREFPRWQEHPDEIVARLPR